MLLNENMFTERVLVSVTKVYRKKVSGLVAHAGLVLSFDQGEQLVLHTSPDKNTQLSTVEEFSAGEKLVKKTIVNATQAIVDRINKRLSTNLKYRLSRHSAALLRINFLINMTHTVNDNFVPILNIQH